MIFVLVVPLLTTNRDSRCSPALILHKLNQLHLRQAQAIQWAKNLQYAMSAFYLRSPLPFEMWKDLD